MSRSSLASSSLGCGTMYDRTVGRLLNISDRKEVLSQGPPGTSVDRTGGTRRRLQERQEAVATEGGT